MNCISQFLLTQIPVGWRLERNEILGCCGSIKLWEDTDRINNTRKIEVSDPSIFCWWWVHYSPCFLLLQFFLFDLILIFMNFNLHCCYLFISLHCYWYLLLFWSGVKINPPKTGGKWEDLFIVGLTLVVSMYEEAVSYFLVYYALIHESMRIYMPKLLRIISPKREENMGHWDEPLVWMDVKNFKNRPFSPMIWAIPCDCFMTDAAKFKTTFVFFLLIIYFGD